MPVSSGDLGEMLFLWARPVLSQFPIKLELSNGGNLSLLCKFHKQYIVVVQLQNKLVHS